MPYDTSNRWLHGLLAEADAMVLDMPWSRRAKKLRRALKARRETD